MFLALVLAVSCGGRKPASPVIVETTKIIKEVQKDTIFNVKADSSFYKAYIDCRDGKPVIFKDSIVYQKGERIEVPKVVLKNNYLKVNCKIDSSAVAFRYYETHTIEEKPKVVFLPKVEYVEKKLTWFQKLQIYAGRIFFIEFVLFLLFIILKILKKV